MMVDDSEKKIIKENISNKKRLKSTIADMYVYDKKIKNLMCLSVDLGIEEMITKKTTLLKQEVFRMAQILCYEYGTDIEDAVVVVHEWADIFDIEYEDDSLFLEAKELMSVNTGDVLNWEKVKDDIFNVISYAYVLGNDTERDSMIENAEQLFGEKDIKSIIIKKIRNICEDDFLKKTLDNVFACVYVTVEEGIKIKNLELVNLKCYANIKIMRLLIGAIMYRDKKIYQSLYLILITALLDGNTYKLDKAGFKDKSIDDIVSFPKFEEVILYKEECEEMIYCDSDITDINEKGRKIFELVKRSVLDGSIEYIYKNLSSVYKDYIINNLEINVKTT